MQWFLAHWIINSLALLIVTHIVKGISVVNPITAIVVAFVIGVVNTFLRPLIIFVTLPINILTLGIFTFFINGFLFYIVSKVVKGFVVTGFWPAFWGYILFSIISLLLSSLVQYRG